METVKVIKNKKVSVTADIYYRYNEGVMLTHYQVPHEYIFITNRHGEAKMYYPDRNEVVLQQNRAFSSENDLLHSFLTNKTADLGLKEIGFSLAETRYQGRLVITRWIAPVLASNTVSQIELVHENSLPIYSSFWNTEGKINKKTYYSNYEYTRQAAIPTMITEIEYLATGDSIVSRKRYKNIRLNNDTRSPYFEFQIPSNARLIK